MFSSDASYIPRQQGPLVSQQQSGLQSGLQSGPQYDLQEENNESSSEEEEDPDDAYVTSVIFT